MECTGQAKTEAQSRAEAAKIEGKAALEQAKLKAEASKIEAVSSNLNNFHNNLCACRTIKQCFIFIIVYS